MLRVEYSALSVFKGFDMVIIPIFNDTSSRFKQNINLDGTIYNLYIYWNHRTEQWFLDIRDNEEEPILTGRLLSPNFPTLRQYVSYEGLPDGEFVLVDIKDDLTDPDVTFDTINVRYQLVFFTNQEIEDAQSS